MYDLKGVADGVGLVVDGAGVLAIILGLLLASARFLAAVAQTRPAATDQARFTSVPSPYRQFRQDLGRAILLGLEFLVAGDIIHTVAVAPSLVNVLVLGLIVLIRTFLSMALEVELDGRWPWQRAAANGRG